MVSYIKQNTADDVYLQASEYDEHEFELYRKSDDELVASMVFNDRGELESFSSFRDVSGITGHLPPKEIRANAEAFIERVRPGLLQSVRFSCMIDFDETYGLIYDKKEEKFGLFLPHSGVKIDIARDGQVHGFHAKAEEYKVIYPPSIISKESAKSIYMETLTLELLISKLDKDMYVNGDGSYRLCYAPVEYVMALEADGSAETIEAYGGFLETYERLDKRHVSESERWPLIGLNDQYVKIAERISGTEREEWWSAAEDSIHPLDIDEWVGDSIQLSFDQETGRLVSVVNNEETRKGAAPITEDEARERALQFLFSLYPQADEQFTMQTSHPSHHFIADKQEGEGEGESEYVFYFQRIHHSIKVDSYVLVIHVGEQSGNILYLETNEIAETLWKTAPFEPAISQEEAKAIICSKLEMERGFKLEYGEEGPAYHVTYLPAFPKTVGHIRLIDALTGEAFYVKTGLMEEA
ncbi:YcdB/YcdC domain-containing protein [Bacillus xiapuensis]|uniref:YcdB/YcdC domain-containing protein n=1 Tax=Bacillus xiapuensis TaxID=2014075 RepID=UPI000C2459E1|nr:YcdB/YcdC domain-containing protein [Bacillus xiapuensis]